MSRRRDKWEKSSTGGSSAGGVEVGGGSDTDTARERGSQIAKNVGVLRVTKAREWREGRKKETRTEVKKMARRAEKRLEDVRGS